MIVLTAHELRKYYGPEPVLESVSFVLRRGERISLVGPNGAGKTTLLKILAGNEEADAGSIETARGVRIGYLEQQPHFPAGRTVWDEARAAMEPLDRMAREAEQLADAISRTCDPAEVQRLGERFEQIHHDLDRLGGYSFDHQVERVLAGLALAGDTFRQPVEQLSGGQQNRLMLARLLLEQPDVLLLDEPSNHLDLEATEWLEAFLTETDQALLVISHDRYFLDKVTNRTLELLGGTVDKFPGNFTAYRRQKAERLEVQRRTFENQQEEIAKLEDFVRRHHFGQKHSQAEDRRKKLERLERVPPPRAIAAPPMGFPAAPRSGDIVMRIERLTKGFGTPLFTDLTFDVLRGEKWGILGKNGCGKTTLLRCLLGSLAPDAGQITIGAGVRIAYFDQRLECVPPACPVLDAVRPTHKDFSEQQRRNLLARFGITGDMVFQTVGCLSGGEQNRVALACLAAEDANLLVLDEPTNHLDLWAREALERALRAFDGSVVFVSHDRFFINQLADHLIVAEPHGLCVHDGNFDSYRFRVAQTASPPVPPRPTTPQTAQHRDASVPRGKPKRRFPYRKQEDLEAEIHERESRIEELHRQLGAPEVVRSGERVKQITAELESQKRSLTQLYDHWEEVVERL